MAYSVKMKSGTICTWHIGQTLPPIKIDSVVSLQADGDELEHIVDQYQCGGQRANTATYCYSIPMPMDKPVVTWYGDIAKTIIVNL